MGLNREATGEEGEVCERERSIWFNLCADQSVIPTLG